MKKTRISVRLAKLNDAHLLLKIHNNSVKRGYFNSKKLIIFKNHIKWLREKLNSNSKIYIGREYNKSDFGYVRFDKINKQIYEVSIGNLPNYYGKGLGTTMLEKALKKFIKKNNPKIITSVVKKFNIRSAKCFLKNGFIETQFDRNKHLTVNQINLKRDRYFELKK